MTYCDFCNTPNPTYSYDAGSEVRVLAVDTGQATQKQVFGKP